MPKRIAIVGGGPSALFLIKCLLEQPDPDVSVEIFEKTDRLGSGMPYGPAGACTEHVTNVSGNEIPDLKESLVDWIKALPATALDHYKIDPETFTAYKVVPRLLFGDYLSSQFERYLQEASRRGIEILVHLGTQVIDVEEQPSAKQIALTLNNAATKSYFDYAILCIGHYWPNRKEGLQSGFYDSPYPPEKLTAMRNQPVALKGCSLTAIDAVRTIARANGSFDHDAGNQLVFRSDPGCPDFRILMESRHAILPGLRFNLEDPHLSRKSLLTKQDYDLHRAQNGGFISLDFIFEKNFKSRFVTHDPSFYAIIKDWTMEEFVEAALASFKSVDPFELFEAELAASYESIRQGKSEYWKEKLAVFSVAMNQPAKYLSAEDMQRFHQELMPLISVVIAFAPQQSCEELIALHKAGRLELVRSDENNPPRSEGGKIILCYQHADGRTKEAIFTSYIDCTGQPHLSLDVLPFPGLVKQGAVSQAYLRFQQPPRKEQPDHTKIIQRGDQWLMEVPGLAITDHFRAVSESGDTQAGLYLMAVPYIGGFNPDYSGLDFCEDASTAIVSEIFSAS